MKVKEVFRFIADPHLIQTGGRYSFLAVLSPPGGGKTHLFKVIIETVKDLQHYFLQKQKNSEKFNINERFEDLLELELNKEYYPDEKYNKISDIILEIIPIGISFNGECDISQYCSYLVNNEPVSSYSHLDIYSRIIYDYFKPKKSFDSFLGIFNYHRDFFSKIESINILLEAIRIHHKTRLVSSLSLSSSSSSSSLSSSSSPSSSSPVKIDDIVVDFHPTFILLVDELHKMDQLMTKIKKSSLPKNEWALIEYRFLNSHLAYPEKKMRAVFPIYSSLDLFIRNLVTEEVEEEFMADKKIVQLSSERTVQFIGLEKMDPDDVLRIITEPLQTNPDVEDGDDD